MNSHLLCECLLHVRFCTVVIYACPHSKVVRVHVVRASSFLHHLSWLSRYKWRWSNKFKLHLLYVSFHGQQLQRRFAAKLLSQTNVKVCRGLWMQLLWISSPGSAVALLCSRVRAERCNKGGVSTGWSSRFNIWAHYYWPLLLAKKIYIYCQIISFDVKKANISRW